MSDTRSPRPSGALFAMEQRALFELGAFAAASPFLRALGRGDRHPVLVLPGFTANDGSTRPLRAILRSQGYWVHGWRLGRNLGPTEKVVVGLAERLETLYAQHERPVSIVGWSLGGIYARELARQFPEQVRQVITLGSPFRLRDEFGSNATALYERYEHTHVDIAADFESPEEDRPPLTVPTTAIYTRTDGVVHWSLCIEAEGPRRENIEVTGSHSGLGFNPYAIAAISDRLAQPEGEWQPFHTRPFVKRLYPQPVWWQPRQPVAA